MIGRRSLFRGTIASVAFAPAALADNDVAEPSGYRTKDYRAPTPATLTGATVLSTDEAVGLWKKHHAVFIDVQPRPPRPPDLPASTIWREKPRSDIPGSIWLADAGYGALAPAMEDYFREGLAKASAGDWGHPLVFYCLTDCWMSWNAAKRALSLGYRNVIWYPGGTDAWSARGFPLEANEPEPRPPVTESK